MDPPPTWFYHFVAVWPQQFTPLRASVASSVSSTFWRTTYSTHALCIIGPQKQFVAAIVTIFVITLTFALRITVREVGTTNRAGRAAGGPGGVASSLLSYQLCGDTATTGGGTGPHG